MDQELAHQLIGVIISGFFGLAIGNFVTNPIYRLPRRESLFLKDPYCGDCNTRLTARDLFPVLSWLMTRGKCRYCGAEVPATYAGTEALIGIIYVICYLKAGFTEPFVLASFGITALIMIAMMLYLDNFFSGKTLACALFLGVLYRAIFEGTMYNALGGAFTGLMVGAVAWRLSGRELIRDVVAFPGYMNLLMAMGAWLPLMHFAVGCLAAAIAIPFRKGGRPWMVEWTIVIYTSIDLLILLRSNLPLE